MARSPAICLHGDSSDSAAPDSRNDCSQSISHPNNAANHRILYLRIQRSLTTLRYCTAPSSLPPPPPPPSAAISCCSQRPNSTNPATAPAARGLAYRVLFNTLRRLYIHIRIDLLVVAMMMYSHMNKSSQVKLSAFAWVLISFSPHPYSLSSQPALF